MRGGFSYTQNTGSPDHNGGTASKTRLGTSHVRTVTAVVTVGGLETAPTVTV